MMLGREGSSLHDHVTLVHHPLQGDIDPRLLADRPDSILTLGISMLPPPPGT